MKFKILPLLTLTALCASGFAHAEGEVLGRNQKAAGHGTSADNSRLDTATGQKVLPDTVSSSNPSNPDAPMAPGPAVGYGEKFRKRMGNPIAGTIGDLSVPAKGNTPNDELERSSGITVSFPAGQTNLSEDAKKQIDAFLGTAQLQNDAPAIAVGSAMGNALPKAEGVKVVTWGDSHQSAGKKSLSGEEQKLAAARSKAITEYLKGKTKDTKVTAYNMAKKPGVFSEIFNRNNDRIRKTLGLTALSPTDGSVGNQAMVLLVLRR